MKGINIVSTGSYAPSRIVTNDDLSKIMDTSDEWISTRTGIRRRHYVEDETTCEMAARAGKSALDAAGIDQSEIGCCVFSTFTPDTMTPTMSCTLQGMLGLPENIFAIDINGACSGFIYGLSVAYGWLLQNPTKYVLLVGSETISRVLNFDDRATSVLFGDGAGAVILGLAEDRPFVFSAGVQSDPSVIRCEGLHRIGEGMVPQVVMDGKDVFRFAVDAVPKCMADVLNQAEKTLDDVDYVICHQANERIISHVYKKLKMPKEKFFVNLQDYGNTSSASIPIALDEMRQKGMLKAGMTLLCVGFGAGLSWGGALFQW